MEAGALVVVVVVEVLKAVGLLIIWWLLEIVITLALCWLLPERTPDKLATGVIFGLPIAAGVIAFLRQFLLATSLTCGLAYGLLYGLVFASGVVIPYGLGYIAAWVEYTERIRGYY
jgi:hypothetical protein